jgi:hypothetical protein
MKPKFTLYSLIAVLSLLTLISCQKEVSFDDDIQVPPPPPGTPGGPAPADIKGEWKFVGETIKNKSTIGFSESGVQFRTVFRADYMSKDNAGVITITNDQFVFAGITGTYEGTVFTDSYVNGALLDEREDPFSGTRPETDESAAYIRNNNDSVTFTDTQALLPEVPGYSALTPTGPIGARLSMSGDTLHIRIRYKVLGSMDAGGGITAAVEAEADGIMNFKR